MFDVTSIPPRTSLKMLVAFYDLTDFSRMSSSMLPNELFDLFENIAEMVGDQVESGGGKVVKFVGDSALIVFPEEQAARGVLCLWEMKKKVDGWLAGKDFGGRLRLQIHFGMVVCGPCGTKTDKRFDVFGTTVNTAARLTSFGFSITPQAFRCLDQAGRKLFKKHTPPVRYIPVEEAHRD